MDRFHSSCSFIHRCMKHICVKFGCWEMTLWIHDVKQLEISSMQLHEVAGQVRCATWCDISGCQLRNDDHFVRRLRMMMQMSTHWMEPTSPVWCHHSEQIILMGYKYIRYLHQSSSINPPYNISMSQFNCNFPETFSLKLAYLSMSFIFKLMPRSWSNNLSWVKVMVLTWMRFI